MRFIACVLVFFLLSPPPSYGIDRSDTLAAHSELNGNIVELNGGGSFAPSSLPWILALLFILLPQSVGNRISGNPTDMGGSGNEMFQFEDWLTFNQDAVDSMMCWAENAPVNDASYDNEDMFDAPNQEEQQEDPAKKKLTIIDETWAFIKEHQITDLSEDVITRDVMKDTLLAFTEEIEDQKANKKKKAKQTKSAIREVERLLHGLDDGVEFYTQILQHKSEFSEEEWAFVSSADCLAVVSGMKAMGTVSSSNYENIKRLLPQLTDNNIAIVRLTYGFTIVNLDLSRRILEKYQVRKNLINLKAVKYHFQYTWPRKGKTKGLTLDPNVKQRMKDLTMFANPSDTIRIDDDRVKDPTKKANAVFNNIAYEGLVAKLFGIDQISASFYLIKSYLHDIEPLKTDRFYIWPFQGFKFKNINNENTNFFYLVFAEGFRKQLKLKMFPHDSTNPNEFLHYYREQDKKLSGTTKKFLNEDYLIDHFEQKGIIFKMPSYMRRYFYNIREKVRGFCMLLNILEEKILIRLSQGQEALEQPVQQNNLIVGDSLAQLEAGKTPTSITTHVGRVIQQPHENFKELDTGPQRVFMGLEQYEIDNKVDTHITPGMPIHEIYIKSISPDWGKAFQKHRASDLNETFDYFMERIDTAAKVRHRNRVGEMVTYIHTDIGQNTNRLAPYATNVDTLKKLLQTALRQMQSSLLTKGTQATLSGTVTFTSADLGGVDSIDMPVSDIIKMLQAFLGSA